jgi:ParB/RepB/Spo0J family partition protein
MNDQSGSPEPPEPEAKQVKVVPIDRIIVGGGRASLDEGKVAELMESIGLLDLLQPIPAAARQGKGGEEQYQLVGGRHRLEATRRLGRTTIRVLILPYNEDLRVELAEIDENLIRNEPTPAQHARLTGRRKQIITALAVQDGTLSQVATASKQALRRAGRKSGPDIGSVRDQANKTGETKDRVQRSYKRFEELGSALLTTIEGTSLDKGAELDALVKLPEGLRHELAERAAAGDKISAKQMPRGGQRGPKRELEPQPPVINIQNASNEYFDWACKYAMVPELDILTERINELHKDLEILAFGESEECRAPERRRERPQKGKFRRWITGQGD